MPKIISLGMAAASFQYSQEEIFKVLHYPKPFWRIFKASEIQHRQFVVPINRSQHFSFQEQQDTYRLEALALARRAIIDALDKRPAADIGALIFCTCTGFVPEPTIAHYLARDLAFAQRRQPNQHRQHGMLHKRARCRL